MKEAGNLGLTDLKFQKNVTKGRKEAGNEGLTDLKFLLVLGDIISRIRFVPSPGQIAELMFLSGGHSYPQSALAAWSVILV